jgi:hypothetical protein
VRDEAFAELDVGAGDDFLQLGLAVRDVPKHAASPKCCDQIFPTE